ncbi:ATPase [Methylacidiphilum caldifontis]|uniref:ATPase n=1 Tax=Methylacidiphilum caldifontis TaxID=2795386 RepID=A0A4Y8PHU9_9BACT|nr:ATPase [Methylacidiphilum caldifontis]QSR89651.1 ATPase [Methylacidiphilum caldifontis]TFE73392.1 ATPase [Methylacidiphilum caldifontis]
MIKHRFTLPLQSKGNVGKSTQALLQIFWMNARSVSWQAYDLDNDNQTLSRAIPEAKLVTLSEEPEADFLKIFRTIPEKSVTVLDPQAHFFRVLLHSLDFTHFLDWSTQSAIRTTLLLFPVDDLSVMDELADIVEKFGDSVDYLVVKNRAKAPKTRMYDGSQLEKELAALGAATLEIPALLSDTRNYLSLLEIELQRPLNILEIISDKKIKMDLFHRVILEDWVKTMFDQYDRIAGYLLPDEEAKRVMETWKKPAEEKKGLFSQRRGSKINLSNLQ